MKAEDREEKRAGVVLRVMVPLLVLAIGGGAAVALIKTKPAAGKRKPPARASLVEVMEVNETNRTVEIEVMGEVVPVREIELRAEVSGRVVEQSPKLVQGGRFTVGETMLVIEPDDYDAAVAQAESALTQARLAEVLEEQRHTIAAEEWELSGQAESADVAKSVALREPHLAAARAARKAAEGALARARRNRERTVLRAPFDCIVLQEFSDVGHIVTQQGKVARLAGTDRFYVQAAVPVESLGRFSVPDSPDGEGAEASIVQRGRDGAAVERSGRVTRLLGDLAPAGRMARVLVAVEKPLEGDTVPLLLGAYVRCVIQGEELSGVIVVPRSAVRDGNRIWIADDSGRLRVQELSIAWQSQDEVCVSSGLMGGDRIVTTQLPTAIPGMALKVMGDAPQKSGSRVDSKLPVEETP
jgi:membrane fusion protein (multidrug efflux system)